MLIILAIIIIMLVIRDYLPAIVIQLYALTIFCRAQKSNDRVRREKEKTAQAKPDAASADDDDDWFAFQKSVVTPAMRFTSSYAEEFYGNKAGKFFLLSCQFSLDRQKPASSSK
jgi:hypothetical protein